MKNKKYWPSSNDPVWLEEGYRINEYFNSHPIKPRILTTYDLVSDAVLRLVLLRPINPNRTKGTIL